MKWIRKRGRDYAVLLFFTLGFNLYFLLLMRTAQVAYLLYLDLLLLVFWVIAEGTAFFVYQQKERRKKLFLKEKEPIYDALSMPEDREVFAHDLAVLERRIQDGFDAHCDLQDYVAKWCHEFKIPLAAALLVSEKINDTDVRISMREQLERMNLQLNQMLQGCRLQSPLFDLQIRQVPLMDCVRASIQNNRFFLIRKQFALDVAVDDVIVYTDETWLTYILDQILSNAIKYAKVSEDAQEERRIRIRSEHSFDNIVLLIEDNGEGISECDVRRVFEKGYTGSNYHNGKYKSTGMGLYLAMQIAQKLDHELSVESCCGEYTRFRIVLRGK
ncbi:MAG: hypothetical protein K2N90_04835 [Lachnospiraceae bacterium]|nr:hypothetical protein [Lachnospiraceae bacterium]